MVLLPFPKNLISLFTENTVSLTNVIFPGAWIFNIIQHQYSKSLSLALTILSFIVISTCPCKLPISVVLALAKSTIVFVSIRKCKNSLTIKNSFDKISLVASPYFCSELTFSMIKIILQLSWISELIFISNQCALSPFSLFKNPFESILLIPLFPSAL